MIVVQGAHEWPGLLREATIPQTISAAARVALASSMAQRATASLEEQRMLCLGVQETLGQAQMKRYAVTREEDVIAGIRVYRFRKHGSESDGRVLLNLHGGGFSKDAGSTTENVPIAALTGIEVVAVRYRMAPEHTYPCAVDDAEAVYRALLESRPASKIVVYGTSAGAILCGELLVRLQAIGLPMPAALGFFSGTADLRRLGDTEYLFRPDQETTDANLFEDYLDGADRSNPAVSPLYADLASFSPTLCIAGTRDFMLSQTTIFHRALLNAGVHSELIVFEAMLHAHWIYLDIPESEEAFRYMAEFFIRHLHRPLPRRDRRVAIFADDPIDCVTIEDHYVRVHGRASSRLLHGTFRDALAQLEGRDGTQVHRSWWVSREALERVVIDGRSVKLVLRNGLRVPVARSCIARLRAAGWINDLARSARPTSA